MFVIVDAVQLLIHRLNRKPPLKKYRYYHYKKFHQNDHVPLALGSIIGTREYTIITRRDRYVPRAIARSIGVGRDGGSAWIAVCCPSGHV